MSHLCSWTGCREKVPDHLWGCRTHWYCLPAHLRGRILSAYVPGQGVADWTDEYRAAFKAAQVWIQQHGRGAVPSR
jgi:hypothetical protein